MNWLLLTLIRDHGSISIMLRDFALLPSPQSSGHAPEPIKQVTKAPHPAITFTDDQ